MVDAPECAPTRGRVASGRFDFMLIEEACLGRRYTYTTVRYRGSSHKYIKCTIIHAENNFTFTTLHWQLVNSIYIVSIASLFA